VITRRKREHAAILALIVLAIGLFFWARGPVQWVFVGAAVAILEEAYLGLGPDVNLKHPRFWLLLGAFVSPILPFVAFGKANVHWWISLPIGLIVTVAGWRFCIRPALQAEPLKPRWLVIPAIALVIALIGWWTSSLAFGLMSACLALWAAALLSLLLMALPKVTPMLPARMSLVAGACALLALGVAARDLARVDGRLRGELQMLAERSSEPPVNTMAAIAAAPAKDRDAALAEAFAPRLFIASDKAAWPLNPLVDVLTSDYIDPRTGERHRSGYPPSLPTSCALRDAKACYVLSDGCFKYDVRCSIAPGTLNYPYGTFTPSGTTASLSPFAVMSVRVLHKDRPSATDDVASSRSAFAHVGVANARLRAKVTDLLQYWLYYGYDRFEAVTPLGRLVQEHESDWELVSVGLGAGKPLFVAYNAHCGGQWLPWAQAPTAYAKPEETARLEKLGLNGLAAVHEPTHPAVMVADGSQASYPASDEVRVPDWTSCTVKHTWGNVVALAAAVREHVDVTREVIPVALPMADRREAPMDFAGRWGLNNHDFCLELPLGIRLNCGGDSKPGSETPPYKEDWIDPFGVMFAKHTWHKGVDPGS